MNKPEIGSVFTNPRGRSYEVVGYMFDASKVVVRNRSNGYYDVAAWEIMTPENGWHKIVGRPAPPTPTASDHHGPAALYAKCGIELKFVIDRMAGDKSCEDQIKGLIAFAKAVGDHGYVDVFEKRLEELQVVEATCANEPG